MAELHLSVPDDEVERWREEAYDLGLSLTTLVRARMNEGESLDSPFLNEMLVDAAREAARQEVRQATFGLTREDLLAAIRAEVDTRITKLRGMTNGNGTLASHNGSENGRLPEPRWSAPRGAH